MYHSRKTYHEKCWICGNIADTDEHSKKRTDIIKAYGKGDYTKKGEFQPILINTKNSNIKGSRDKKLTFRDVLCSKCNNELSQPFDISYEKFSDYISNNIDLIQKSNKLDFEYIYGSDWSCQLRNLYKYFIKIFGCQLSKGNIHISENIINFLTSKTDILEHVKFKFAIKPDIISLQKFENRGYYHLFHGGLEWIGVSENQAETILSWFTNYGVSIYWVYNKSIEIENNYPPFTFKQEEIVKVQMSDSLPKETNKIQELVVFIESNSYNKLDWIDSILNN